MKLPSPGFLLQATIQTIQRFPSPLVFAFMGVLAFFMLLNKDGFTHEWQCILMVSGLGLPLMTGLTVFSEARGWDLKRKWLSQSAGLLFLLVYWYTLDPWAKGFEYRQLPSFGALLLIAHLFVAVAPYLNNRPVRDFWEYNKEIFANLVIGLCFSLILAVGISLAILAVDQLFDAEIDKKTYPRLFSVVFGLFNTTYFLYHFPKEYHFADTDEGYNTVFKNLSKYILIPIAVLYFLILYAYSIKIIGTWTLPKGWVGSLVIGFSIVGIFTYLLNFYLPEQDKTRYVHLFRRFFWWILLPLTALLIVAIARRIGDYGVTELRYLVAHTGAWLVVNCLYFLLSKKDNLKFIPISLALFSLIWAFGPLSAGAISERSQMNRIRNILSQNGRMENGKAKPGVNPVSKSDCDQFESAVNFLQSRDRLDILSPMLPMSVEKLPGSRDDVGKLRAYLGMIYKDTDTPLETTRVYFNVKGANIDIQGFKQFKPLSLNHTNEVNFNEKGDYFRISQDGKRLEWLNYDGNRATLVDAFDLQPVSKEWYELGKGQADYVHLTLTQATKEFHGKNRTLRIIIESSMVEWNEIIYKVAYINGYAFIK